MNGFIRRFIALFLLLFLVFSLSCIAADKNGILSLYKNHAEDTAPFNVVNMLPGDRVSKDYTVQISYTGTVLLNFEVVIKDGSEPLSEVLLISVFVEENNELLYEGAIGEMPAVATTCTTRGRTTDSLNYNINVWLPTSVGDEYENKQLEADFYWWADTAPVKPHTPPTIKDDEGNSVFYLCQDGMGGYNKYSPLPEGSTHVIKSPDELVGINVPDGKEIVAWQVVECDCDSDTCDLVGKTFLFGEELVVPSGDVYLAPVYGDVEKPIDPPVVVPTYTITYISSESEETVHVVDGVLGGDSVTVLDFSDIDTFVLPEGKHFVAWEIIYCSCGSEACDFLGKTFSEHDGFTMPEGDVILRAIYEDVTTPVDPTDPDDPSGELIDPPHTGDYSNIFLWVLIMVLCVIIIILLTRRSDNREKTSNLSRGIIICLIIIVVLAIALSLTTFALVRSMISVEGNVFKTGEVKINLNDGDPIIKAHEFLFEPGMTVVKDFFIENESTDPVYYRIFFDEIEGGLAEVLDIKISDGTEVLFEGKVSELVSSNPDIKSSTLSVNEKCNLQATFYFPKNSKNSTQNLTLSFVLCAQATQMRNNPTGEFI